MHGHSVKCVSCIGCCVIWFLRVCVLCGTISLSLVRVFSCSVTLLQEKMFSGVTTNTTFGSPVASESAPAPEVEYIPAPAPVCEYVAPAPEVEDSAPVLVAKAAPAKSKSCRSAVVASAPHVVESLPLSAPTQRAREERDATGRAVASRLGLAWPPANRIRRPGRPTADAQWCDALHNWTRDVAFVYHDDELRVQRERLRGWRPGDAMVPAAPSSHIELAGVSAAAASDSPVIAYHRSSHVVRRWTTWYAVTRGERGVPSVAIVHELIDQWPDVFGSWLTAHLLRRWVRKPVPHRVRPHEGLLPMLSEVVQRIYSAGVPMSARGFQLLFNELAAEHGFPSTHFGRKWTYRFLHELGMRYRKAQSAKVRDIPPDVLEREERALLRKMVWWSARTRCRQNAFSIWTKQHSLSSCYRRQVGRRSTTPRTRSAEEETVEQLHSLSREAKALRRCSMLKALYGSFASKGPR